MKIPNSRATGITVATPGHLRTPNYSTEQKPILKRKSALKLIFERSMSQQVLLPEAEDDFGQPLSRICSAGLGQLHHRVGDVTYSDRSSPTAFLSRGKVASKERHHVQFNDEVVQCIAIDANDITGGLWSELDNDEPCLYTSGAAAERTPSKGPLSSCNTSHKSFGSRGKTINVLPSTTLHHCRDVSEPRVRPDFNELPTTSVFSKLCHWLSCSSDTS